MTSNPGLEIEDAKGELVWNDTRKSILKALLYFNVFQYPLLKEELLRYCEAGLSIAELQSELDKLLLGGYIFSLHDFFSVQSKFDLADKRILGNKKAEKMLKKAQQHTKWMTVLPFIECVCISGSLSKLYADDSSDVDYFVVTNPNRLWIFRTFTGITVKILKLLGKHKYLCPNYIIASDQLIIENKNIFSAMEVITLIPIYGRNNYNLLLNHNQWVKAYFPAEFEPRFEYLINDSSGLFKRFLLQLNKLNLWHRLDVFLYNSHKWHYGRKFRDEDSRNVNYSISHFKMHTSRHRHKILTRYEEAINQFQQKYSVDLEAKY